ncbi:MAG TPA: hypothetical protein VJR92_11240 [Gemmatimonadaceae bacterium]|nr:hypothetical protein [Gemmatimonadaceae bacterium]
MRRPDDWLTHPSVARIESVAKILGDLNARIVYIGGAIAPILQTEPPFPSARITKDVDALAATVDYKEHARVQQQLRKLGFREASAEPHAHRWVAPSGIIFDLVPAGDHLGASGQRWDRLTLKTAVTLQLRRKVTVRHASAAAFLALKFAAFHDRGAADPAASHDLEDIVCLIASRSTIVEDVASTRAEIAQYVGAECRALVAHAYYDDLLAGNLNHAFNPRSTIALVQDRLAKLSAV